MSLLLQFYFKIVRSCDREEDATLDPPGSTRPYENVPPLPAPVANLVAPATDSPGTTGLPRSISYCIAWNHE